MSLLAAECGFSGRFLLRRCKELGLFLAVLTQANTLWADTANVSEMYFFDIPSLPLNQSILEFAVQADCEVLAQEQDLQQQKGSRVFGYHSPLNAIRKMLGDAGLSAEFLAETQSYVIRRKPPQLAESESHLNAVQEILVTGKRYPLRYQTIVSSEDRYGNTIFDSARAHNILPQAVLADSAIDNLAEALNYVSSATPGDGLLGSNDDYFIRGFPRQNTYINGLRLSNSTAIQIIPETIERLDVLKGPSMLFYGQSSAGGIVDVSRKQPTRKDGFVAEFMLGEHDRQKFFVEVNKADLPAGLNLLFMGMDDKQRENAAGQYRRQLFSVRGKAQAKKHTSYNIGYEYHYLNKATALNLPIFSSISQFLPYRHRDFIRQAEDDFDATAELLDGSASYSLTPDWQILSSFMIQREFRDGIRTEIDFLDQTHALLPQITPPRVGVAFITEQVIAPILHADYNFMFGTVESLYDQHETEHAYTGNIALNGRLLTGVIEHRLIFGLDLYRQRLQRQFLVEKRVFQNTQILSKTVLDDPQQILLDTLLRSPPMTSELESRTAKANREDWGNYLQVRSNWTASWSTTLGWRYSRFYDMRGKNGGNNPDLQGTFEDWLFQAGSSWLLTDAISLYSNYSETLNLNYLIDDFDRFVEGPETSRQQEIGLKWQAQDGQALGTVSLFSINSSDINTIKFQSGYRTLQAPQRRQVQGVEIDLTWRINNWIEWLASGAITHHDTRQNSSRGTVPPLVADNTLGVFGRFSLPREWTTYVGLNYVSDRSIESEELTKLEQYTLMDFALEKVLTTDIGQWRIRATVKNLLNEYHPSVAFPGLRASPNQDRRALIELAVKF